MSPRSFTYLLFLMVVVIGMVLVLLTAIASVSTLVRRWFAVRHGACDDAIQLDFESDHLGDASTESELR